MRQFIVFVAWAVVGLACANAWGQGRVLDAMEDPAAWKVITSDQVTLKVTAEDGRDGKCLRLDYVFGAGTGYAIIQQAIDVEVAENYEFSYQIRGMGNANNLEFKLLDASGDNVWWHVHRALEFPGAWTRIVEKKRDIEFAWGPLAGATLTKVSKIEFAISSSNGGKGSVWIDSLMYRALPLPREGPLVLKPAPFERDQTAALAIDDDASTMWMPTDTGGQVSLSVDLGESAEFGGVDLVWVEPPHRFALQASDDGEAWIDLCPMRRAGVERTVVATPNAQARYLRLVCLARRGVPVALATMRVRPAEFSSTPNAMMSELAKELPRGRLPREFLGEQSYWTVVGVDGGASEALINEEGMVEVGKRSFSLEPFLEEKGADGAGRLLTWADGRHGASLRDGWMPIPNVVRAHEGVSLSISAFAVPRDGDATRSDLYVKYGMRNSGSAAGTWALHIAARPFQVNPPWQRLNFEGGVAAVSRMAVVQGAQPGLRIDKGRRVDAMFVPTRMAAVAWDQGEIVDWLAAGMRADTFEAESADGLCSGVISVDVTLEASEVKTFTVRVPLDGAAEDTPRAMEDWWAVTAREAAVAAAWERRSSTKVIVPKADQWVADTFRAQLAYILINRDGPAIQPGSRSYERSWARDGSMTSAALLACGHAEEVKAWIDWYGSHIFPDGKVPCVVDARGPDPVPEYDSQGEYIWAVAEYMRYEHDWDFLKQHRESVIRAAGYIGKLRAQRMTDEYKGGKWPEHACYGLVPESISHEGYSAKPMHSYWDNFFCVLGLREASAVDLMGRYPVAPSSFEGQAAEMASHVKASIAAVMAHKKIDYIPGCVELGDFDATSTTIALFPTGADAYLPKEWLDRTFEKYWEFAQDRMKPGAKWDAYTPYELRHVGAFVRLGQRERAYTLLKWFHLHQRPEGWRHWAEVVFKDPLTPKFIGDMPHTWVGSDYLNSILSMFVLREEERTVLFAGVPGEWVDGGEVVGFEKIVTPHGTLSGTMQRLGAEVHVSISGPPEVVQHGLYLRLPEVVNTGGDVRVTELPASLTFTLR